MTAEARHIDDEEVLTHYGKELEFRTAPRPGREHSMSLLLGRFTAEEAGNRVLKAALGNGRDSARYTTAHKLPSPDSRVVEVYNEHDVPTAGVVQQHGVDYLFECISEERSGLSVWTYTLISTAERSRIEEATPEAFEALMDSVLHAHASVLAIALEGQGIRASTEVDDWFQDGPRELDRLFELFKQVQQGLLEDAELQRVALRPMFTPSAAQPAPSPSNG